MKTVISILMGGGEFLSCQHNCQGATLMVCPRAANRSSRGGFVSNCLFRELFHVQGFGEVVLSDPTNGILNILVLLLSMSYCV